MVWSLMMPNLNYDIIGTMEEISRCCLLSDIASDIFLSRGNILSGQKIDETRNEHSGFKLIGKFSLASQMYIFYVLAALAALFPNVEVVWGAAISTSSRQTGLQSFSCLVGLSGLFLTFFEMLMGHYSRHD